MLPMVLVYLHEFLRKIFIVWWSCGLVPCVQDDGKYEKAPGDELSIELSLVFGTLICSVSTVLYLGLLPYSNTCVVRCVVSCEVDCSLVLTPIASSEVLDVVLDAMGCEIFGRFRRRRAKTISRFFLRFSFSSILCKCNTTNDTVYGLWS